MDLSRPCWISTLREIQGSSQAYADHPDHQRHPARESGAAQPEGEQHGSEQEVRQSEQERDELRSAAVVSMPIATSRGTSSVVTRTKTMFAALDRGLLLQGDTAAIRGMNCRIHRAHETRWRLTCESA
jgi:hypothetical protein